MKSNIKFMGFLLTVVIVFAACNNPFFPKKAIEDGMYPGGETSGGGLPQQLAAPSNLNVSGITLTWNAVADASGYAVDVDGVEYPSALASFSLSVLTDYKAYTIKVKALGDGTAYTDSEWSDTTSYNFPEPQGIPALATPVNLQIIGTNLTWGAVADAVRYSVEINGMENVAASNNFSLSGLTAPGTYTIKVKAVGDNVSKKNSLWSGGVQYTVTIQGIAQQLAKPTNLQINDAVLTWDAVSGASGYLVQVDDNVVVNNGISTSYSLESLSYSTYLIKVKAIGNGTTYTDSEWSQAIIYEFEDPSLTPDPIAFTDTETRIVKTYGDVVFANTITAAHSGTGAITYSSGDETVATVNGSGTVTIHKAGTVLIIARKAADTVYAGASKSYTLTVEPKAVTITGLSVANKFYDGTTAATVSGTATINGLIGGDVVTVSYGTASFADKNAADGKAVTFSGYSLTGANAGNYSLSQPTATANITPYSLTGNILISRTWLSPLDGENSTSITLNLPPAEEDTLSVTLTSPLPSGLNYNAGTQTFIYDGISAFTNSVNISLNALTANSNYSNGTQTLAINIYDGQADYTGTGYDRRIPVTQANIMSFNTYANTTDGLTRHYKLVENITLTATENNWTAIGTNTSPNPATQFSGSFDGQTHTITGININKPDTRYQGFFGYISGTVRNLGLVGGTIIGDYNVGGVVGQNYGTVQNCYATGDVSGYYYAGGVVGYNAGMIENCYATGAVSGYDSVGGVVGSSGSYGGGIVQNCYATGDVSGNSSVGGVIGYNTRGTVQNCYATGDVSGYDSVGGVVGRNSSGTVQNCYATGDVSDSGSGIGIGIVGGVVGYNISSTVQNCVALNTSVRASSPSSGVGRVVGFHNGTGSLSNNYAQNPMIVQYRWNGTTGTDKTINAGLDTVDGKNITATEWNTVSWWITAGNWDTVNGSVWDTAVWDIANGRLPILRDMPGTQSMQR